MGHRFDTIAVAPLIKDIEFGGLIADKALSQTPILATFDERKPRSSSPSIFRPNAAEIHKWRRLIENLFGKLKAFKRIAMRSDKTDQSSSAMIHLAASAVQWR